MVGRFPTPHPEVNKVVNLLHSKIVEILKDQLVGMYLFGSIANGGFDNESDIDVVVATVDDIDQETFSELSDMHKRISMLDSPWAFQLEVSYIPLVALRRHDPANNKHPHLDRGEGEKLKTMRHDSDWVIQRYILRERGITVTGHEPGTLIDPVSPVDLKWAARDITNTWFRGFLDDSSVLETRGYQSYTVLTLCRILYTLHYGDVVSKQIAAEWAKEHLEAKWGPLIQRAWAGRRNPGKPTRHSERKETLDFIRYTLERTK